jgi:hypothetical protein
MHVLSSTLAHLAAMPRNIHAASEPKGIPSCSKDEFATMFGISNLANDYPSSRHRKQYPAIREMEAQGGLIDLHVPTVVWRRSTAEKNKSN